MNDMMYLYVAYTVIWLGVFIYAAYLHGRQAELGKELELVVERVRRIEPGKR